MSNFKKMAIAGAVSVALFGVTGAEAHVMYNTYNAGGASNTDGWVWGGISTPNGATVNPNNFAAANPGFTGTSDSNGDGFGDAPFGYVGSAHLNWAAALHHAGGSYEVSAANSGGLAEVDTGAGAWMDDGAGDLSKRTGWKHQTDIGLIKADEDMKVTITAEVVGGAAFSNFGMTLFEGMDTNTGDYRHHGSWNSNATPSESDNPFGTTGLTFLKWDNTVDSVNAFTFFAKAGTVYSLYLGGNTLLGRWNANIADYKLIITTSAVPVPGAVWLFGSAMAGLVGFGRRKAAVKA